MAIARLGRPSWWLRLMQAARASRRMATRAKRLGGVRAPWRSRFSRSLQVQKTDSIRCRMGARCGPVGGSSAWWSQHAGAEHVDGVGELAAGVALVADDRFAAAECARQQREATSRSGRSAATRAAALGAPSGRAGEMEPHPPKPAGAAVRVAVAADVGQLGAARSLERAAALDRGRVEQEQVVARTGALSGEHADQRLDHLRQPGPPLVQRILARQPRKEVAELAARRAPRAGSDDRWGSPSAPGQHRA